MERVRNFFRWLGHPFRAVRALFPFSQEGRQTLVYLMFALACPVLTLVGLHVLDRTEKSEQWSIYAEMARTFGWSLFVMTASIGLFISIRQLKIGPTGAELNSKDDAVEAAKKVAEDVKAKADESVAEVAHAAPATNPAGEEL